MPSIPDHPTGTHRHIGFGETDIHSYGAPVNLTKPSLISQARHLFSYQALA
jgi:hypothetical protein